MKYALLIWHEEQESDEAERDASFAAHMAFIGEATEAGVMAGGEALYPSLQTKQVQVRAGNMLTIDGPYAETKESMGGFYLVDCDTEEEALQWASKIPEAKSGRIEVRKVMEFN